MQKSFSVQSKKRGDLESLFSEFITNYDEQKQIAASIDLFADDVDRYIEDKEKQKVSQELIDSQEAQLISAHKEANHIPYPSTIFYSGENAEIVSLSRDELIRQKTEIQNCGYIIARNEIRRLIDNDSLKSQIKLIKTIRTFLADKEGDIRQAMVTGLLSNTDTISSLALSIEKLEKLTLTKDTILKDVEVVITYDRERSFQKCFETIKNEIQEKEKRVMNLSSEIELLTNNNKILMLQQTYEKVKNLITESNNITDFSYEQFVSKINAIDSILANRSQETLRMKLKEEKKKNETLDTEISKLRILKNDAIQKANSIRDIVESLSRDEYQKIGPTLSKFYNKLIRVGDNDGINIVHVKEWNSNYNSAPDYLCEICSAAHTPLDNLFIVPGNHDVEIGGDARLELIKRLTDWSTDYYRSDLVAIES